MGGKWPGKGWWLGGLLCLLAGSAGANGTTASGHSDASVRPLQFGLLPYVSTRKLFTYYRPLRDYLVRILGRPVHLSTAPDFSTYLQRAGEGEYDLYHTAPHFAALAEARYGYRRVSRLLRDLDGSVVVARDGPIQSAADLRGRTLATPDSLAIISFLGERWLRDNGLRPGMDVEVQHLASHNSAILAVARGEAEAAVTSAAVFENMPAQISRRLRVLASTRAVPHMMFMAGSRLSDEEYRTLRQALLAYTAEGAGRDFFALTGYGDMVPIRDEDMRRLQPFVRILNDHLRQVSQTPSSKRPTTWGHH
ncbi:MAG TPA: phosphate/phosphite/phosphonate ABC transporter substrate-binding protein [Gammaproteobacteria bacterium]|nr:phosphate/phosphite/phosphonate ABC transporter substrate-binding protein [Gammaproteobacteria bacterium]